MDQIRDIKRRHASGVSIREVSREFNVSRNTVRRYLRLDQEPGGYRMKTNRQPSVKDKIRPFVKDLFCQEKENDIPRKQRLTAGRAHRLVLAAGLEASASTVRSLVREIRLELRDPLKHAFLPLAYDPGRDAQVDFFEGYVNLENGYREKVHILLVRACYSGRCFAYAAPNQTREALLEGLMQAFEFFGGVFPNIWFDNLTPAVKRVLKGKTRELQTGFAVFEAHYGFKAEFCAPGKGNEKGGVENEVKFSRSEILTPMPTVKGREDVQDLCDNWMSSEVDRTRRGRAKTIGEYWEDEVPNLMGLPISRFDAARVITTKVTPRSWVTFGTNCYSVPVEWVGYEVELKLDAEQVTVLCKGKDPVKHKRSYQRHQMELKLEHYLPLLHRKCRGLDRSVPFRLWVKDADPCWNALLLAIRQHRGEVCGSREFVDIIKLCGTWERILVVEAIKSTLAHQEVSLSTVRYFLWQKKRNEDPEIEPIDYDGPHVDCGSLADYDALCFGNGVAHE